MINVAAVHHEIQCRYRGSAVGVSPDMDRKSPHLDPFRRRCPTGLHEADAKACIDTISILRKTA